MFTTFEAATTDLDDRGTLTSSCRLTNINLQFGFGPLLYLVSVGVAVFSVLGSTLFDIALAAFFALPAFTFADAQQRSSSESAAVRVTPVIPERRIDERAPRRRVRPNHRPREVDRVGSLECVLCARTRQHTRPVAR